MAVEQPAEGIHGQCIFFVVPAFEVPDITIDTRDGNAAPAIGRHGEFVVKDIIIDQEYRIDPDGKGNCCDELCRH